LRTRWLPRAVLFVPVPLARPLVRLRVCWLTVTLRATVAVTFTRYTRARYLRLRCTALVPVTFAVPGYVGYCAVGYWLVAFARLAVTVTTVPCVLPVVPPALRLLVAAPLTVPSYARFTQLPVAFARYAVPVTARAPCPRLPQLVICYPTPLPLRCYRLVIAPVTHALLLLRLPHVCPVAVGSWLIWFNAVPTRTV